MSKLLVRDLDYRPFTWDRKERKGVAFASDLPRVWLDRIWDDAADQGVRVVGAHETKLFLLLREEFKDGELVAWHFREFTSKDGPWTLVVFND